MSFIVAIDGPAAAGKGTISKAVASTFGFAHLDTGLLYRAVGVKVLDGVDPIHAAQTLDPSDLHRQNLRTAKIAQAASKVAAIPEVRSALIDFQRKFASQEGGAVLDGRDIGTVICPAADVKLFITASPQVRAQRRFDELTSKGAETTFETVLKDVIERDTRDASRKDAPMVAATDATKIDTSDLSIEAAIEASITAIKNKFQST